MPRPMMKRKEHSLPPSHCQDDDSEIGSAPFDEPPLANSDPAEAAEQDGECQATDTQSFGQSEPSQEENGIKKKVSTSNRKEVVVHPMDSDEEKCVVDNAATWNGVVSVTTGNQGTVVVEENETSICQSSIEEIGKKKAKRVAFIVCLSVVLGAILASILLTSGDDNGLFIHLPSDSNPTGEMKAILVGKLEGVSNGQQIGHSVSLGGENGNLVAFVGEGVVGVSRFNDTGLGNWSSIESVAALFGEIPETASISLSTELDRLALAYQGKLEVHEYSTLYQQWTRRVVLNDGLSTLGINGPSTVAMSGNGGLVAFVQPDVGLEILNVTTWDRTIVPMTPNASILQVELSQNGQIVAVLTEAGVEWKVLSGESDITWVNLIEPLTDIHHPAAISLSGDGTTLAVTSATQTVVHSTTTGDEEPSVYSIEQGGIDVSIDHDGQLLAIGRNGHTPIRTERFSSISLYRRSTHPQSSTIGYDLVEIVSLDDPSAASVSLQRGNITAMVVGLPDDGPRQKGSVSFYQVEDAQSVQP